MLIAATESPIEQLSLGIASLIVLLVVAALTEWTRRRTVRIDETVGETEGDHATGEDLTIAHHVAATDVAVAGMAEQISTLVDLMRTSDALLRTRLDHIDAVLGARGATLDDIKRSLAAQGERLGTLDRRLTVVETRLDITPT